MELISREDAIEVALSLMNDTNKNIVEQTANEVLHDVIQCVHNIPTIEERKEGHWIDADEINEQLDTYLANCSVCNCQMDVHENRGYFKFCPNCGAKMKGE